MIYFKKLIFGILFIFSVAFFASQINPYFEDFSLLFSLSFNTLYQIIILVIVISGVAYLFTIFAVLASDWMLALPVIFFACVSNIAFIPAPTSYYLALGLFMVFAFSFFQIYNKTTKDPTSFNVSGNIVKPSRSLVTLIILASAFVFFFAISAGGIDKITQKIVDFAINISGDIMKTQQLPQNADANPTNNLSISPEQIKLLKANPDLLKQSGLDPAILDSLGTQNKNTTATDLAVEAAKPLISKQINDMIQPIIPALPFLLAFLFYLNFQFFASITSLILSPIIYLLFWILEKTGFITFTTEMREVKKLVV